jgi:hypothetical protein
VEASLLRFGHFVRCVAGFSSVPGLAGWCGAQQTSPRKCADEEEYHTLGKQSQNLVMSSKAEGQTVGRLSRRAASMMLKKMVSSNVSPIKKVRPSVAEYPAASAPRLLPSLSSSSLPFQPVSTHKSSKSTAPSAPMDGRFLDQHGRERKSTPSSDPLQYRSHTLPRPPSDLSAPSQLPNKSDGGIPASMRWVVDSREQLAKVATLALTECESRGTIQRRLQERKTANTTTSIHWNDKIEYTTNTQRSFVVPGGTPRDPYADLKRAKQLKTQLQQSRIDLGSGFGGNDEAWVTDKQHFERVVEAAKKQAGFEGRNPGDDARRAKELKKYLQRTTLELSHGGKTDWITNTMRSYMVPDGSPRDPFADLKRAKQLKQALQKSQVDLGSGFGGNDEAWVTDKQFFEKVVEDAKKQAGFEGRNPAADREKAKELKKYLQRTTLQLGFDERYM